MINAPQLVIDALSSDNVRYANLISVNLGDAYNQGSDIIIRLTDCGHKISYGGNEYTPDNNLVGIDGISRKASVGSDSVDVVFSVTDENLISAIKSERYINKPTTIERVILQDGLVVGDFAIPVRTAWGLSHSISGDEKDREVTLTIDSTLGDMGGDNGWYAVNSSHEQRYAGDKVMKHSSTVMTEEQAARYTTNFEGVINNRVKPPALSKIYGYKNAELVPICMLKHRKSHSSYRHYYTTFIYVINIGECASIDLRNLTRDGVKFEPQIVTDESTDQSGWSMRVRTPDENLIPIKSDTKLNFWRDRMDSGELARLDGMYGKGLTLLFLLDRNRDDWRTAPPKLNVPVLGSPVFDPRTGETSFSRNPALQYADYLRSTQYGAGKRGIPVTDDNISSLADHFDQIPDSVGNDGINEIHIDVQVDTGKPIVDNMNIWMEGVRLYTSDYYGQFRIHAETKSAVVWSINEDELLGIPEYESGEFTDRLNQLTYTVKQMVKDNTVGANPNDLVEVDVEAVYPPEGSQTHLDWLSEDGGIASFDSEELSYVTELEQAYYWAMVDARISRQPRTLKLPVGYQGWLSEVGDVIEFTSEVLDMTSTLWRIDEVTEDEDTVELSLVSYDDNFYTPDPDAIPEPTAYAKVPVETNLGAVTGLAIVERDGLYYIDWTPLSSANVAWYAIEVIKDGEIYYDEPKIAQPPYLMNSLVAGSYQVTVVAIGVGSEGEPSTLAFDIQLPVVPTVNITVGTFDAEITPVVAQNYLGTTFELRTSFDNDFDNSTSRGVSRRFTLIGLNSETEYFYWIRTINAIGQSGWLAGSFTTNAGEEISGVISNLDRSQLNEDTKSLIDQLDRNIEGNIPDKLDGFEFVITKESAKRQGLERAVFDTTAAYAAWRNEYERRTLNDETLIDAAVYIDPLTGKIVNRAFAYSDEKFTEAALLIDGVDAKVTIEAARVTQVEGRLTSAEAELIVQAGQITQRATHTEVDQAVAEGISALTPAYSWQYNTGLDGWTGGAWNAQGYIDVAANGTLSIAGISFVADDNPIVQINVNLASRNDGLLSWNGGNQNIPIDSAETSVLGEFSVVRLTLNDSDGWAGEITNLTISFTNATKIDSVEIGKRGANDLALENLTVRTTTIEQDMDAGTGRMSTYATTQWVTDFGYQTTSDVEAAIDSFDTTYSITATLTDLDENDTLNKANSAQTWVDGADANIRNSVIAYNAEDGGIDEQITQAQTDIDGVKGQVSDQVTSVSGMQLDIEDQSIEGVLAAFDNFIAKNDIVKGDVKLSYAEQKITALSTEQEATASQVVTLSTQTDKASADAHAALEAISNDRQATVERTATLRAEMSEGDTEAVAEANEYTRASVGYCVDADGNITGESDAVACVAAGNSWFDGVLSEFIRKLQIAKGDDKASVDDIRQVFERQDGKLVARGGMVTDVNGLLSGWLNNNDGTLSSFDILANVFRWGIWQDDEFKPLLSLDGTDPQKPVGVFQGRLELGDGHVVSSQDDIKADDGTAISVELQYSVDGESDWHFPMVDGDVYQRSRTKTQIGNQTPTYGSWSAAAEIKGNTGQSGANTAPVVIYFLGGDTAPSAQPSNGAVYDFTNGGFTPDESSLNGWSISPPSAAIGKTIWIKYAVASSINSTATVNRADWSSPAIHNVNGADGTAQTPEFEYSVDGASGWHFPMADGDYFQRTRIKTQIGDGTPTYSDWSAAARIRKDGDSIKGDEGNRGAGMYEAGTADGVWDDDVANATVPQGLPVESDVVTIYKISDPKTQTTKRYNGSLWESFTLHVHGSVLVDDTVDGDKIIARTRIRSPKVEFIGATHMRISAADGFGSTNQFIEWFGVKQLVGGEVNYSALSEANAITYLRTDGQAYFGGAIIAGTLNTSLSTSDLSPTAQVQIGAFGSNGGIIAINCSITMSSDQTVNSSTEPATPDVPLCTIVLEELVGGNWVSRQTGNYTGESGKDVSFDTDTLKWVGNLTQSLVGSFTYTDSKQTATDRTYRLRITSRTGFQYLGVTSATQRLSINSQE